MKLSTLLVMGFLIAGAALRAATPEENVKSLGLVLPPAASPVANYVPVVRTGDLVFLAGHIPRDDAGQVITGKVGETVTMAEAQDAARRTALALLATLRQELGSLDRVKRIVRVEGFVNCPTDFTAQSSVINGCSDLLIEVFGDQGRHARMAIGAGSLPLNTTVEIALIAEVD
ncbi:RidA family protein [Synoicihabitans lomoniglobus]|uniref:RidA family protein n=1 Tax=Synoicihabitans lomoniglobus TaxID=2909285 RepID=A0AAF0I4R0_9BACT|nr:RidA family protein [Opitutaceae bacterium LMO-M01]WED66973.1 RidA family protein [Opitutaceae bacterium LMO-M01]